MKNARIAWKQDLLLKYEALQGQFYWIQKSVRAQGIKFKVSGKVRADGRSEPVNCNSHGSAQASEHALKLYGVFH
jgi:hypothetical protein